MAANKARLRMWVKALRSGEYEQGRGCLRFDDRYCCLGVACEVYRLREGGRWTKVWVWGTADSFLPVSNEEGSNAELPPEVSEWYGVGNNPLIGRELPATVVNDNNQESFERIASRIEKYYKLR